MLTVTRRQALFTATATAALGSTAVPTAQFGKFNLSRLIVGGNPISANSHVSRAVDLEMRDYFTTENAKRLLRACEKAGVNTWQSRGDRHIMRLLNEYRTEGGKIQWVAQTASEYGDLRRNLSEISGMKPIAIYHHGSMTDRFWQADHPEKIADSLKAIRQTGAMVGLGTHIPEVIDYAEDRHWDVDFYMTCIYHLTRSPEQNARLAGRPLEGELFWDADREQMLARVKKTAKPCLIFKVYGATRHCDTPERRQAAINLAFDYAKPSDSIVVGMFPKLSEQVEENVRMVARAVARA
ncbi:MAG: hypothetical protein NTY38_27555 [Acidobacteria bacterium]|nr:hypothetical protein [Acidobacteriota bacterium]